MQIVVKLRKELQSFETLYISLQDFATDDNLNKSCKTTANLVQKYNNSKNIMITSYLLMKIFAVEVRGDY